MLGVPRDTNTYILFHEILFYKIRNHHYKVINPPKYRLHAIISSGLYIYFLPHFSVWFIIKSDYYYRQFMKKQGNAGLKSMIYNQEWFQIKSGL